MTKPKDTDARTTERDPDTDAIQEGGLPKDHKSAEAGDNRRAGDVDGNAHAAKPKPPSRPH